MAPPFVKMLAHHHWSIDQCRDHRYDHEHDHERIVVHDMACSLVMVDESTMMCP